MGLNHLVIDDIKERVNLCALNHQLKKFVGIAKSSDAVGSSRLFVLIQSINKDKGKAMPRILGVDIPKEKRIEASLPYIYGIGLTRARDVLKQANIDLNRRAKDLTDEEIARITSIIQTNYIVEGDLRREISQNIKRFVDSGSYRGMRHRKGLPVRGQRTRTNARTRKGRKPIVGSMKKPEPAQKG